MNPANGAAVALTNDASVGRIAVSGDWLQLRHVSAEDAGRFRCQASNAHGQVEAEFQLDVVAKLTVSLEPRRQVTLLYLIFRGILSGCTIPKHSLALLILNDIETRALLTASTYRSIRNSNMK